MGILVESLRKYFGPHAALAGISLDVPKNAFFYVVGPYGSGKSTLRRAIAGLETTDARPIALECKPVFDRHTTMPP